LLSVVAITLLSSYAIRAPGSGQFGQDEVSYTGNPDSDGADPTAWAGRLNRQKLEEVADLKRSTQGRSSVKLAPLWRQALTLGKRNFLLGAGPGMFEWLYPTVRGWQARADHTGNQYFNIFAEYGLAGCALLLWVITSFVIAVLQILDVRVGRQYAARPSNRNAFAIGGLAILAAMIVDAAIDLNLRVGGNLFTLLALLAAVLTCGVNRRADDDDDAGQPGRYMAVRVRGLSRLVLVAGLLGLLALLGARFWRTYPSYLLVRRGDRAATQFDWAGAQQDYLRAWNSDRRNFEAAAALGDLNAAHATWNIRQRESLSTEAVGWYQRALTVNPYAYDLYIRIGRLFDALGNRERALENYRAALQADPKNASYHAQLGCHALRWGDTELAAKSFQMASELGGADPLPTFDPPNPAKSGA
jgi:tetratricopeptide (TPR) repeat protein